MASNTESRVREAIASYEVQQRRAGGNKVLRRQARNQFNRTINELIETEGEAAVFAAFEAGDWNKPLP